MFSGGRKFKHPLDSGFSLKKAGDTGNTNWDFQFNNNTDLDSWQEREVKKFQDVKMAFYGYVLKPNDLLISPEQDGTYYLAKWKNNREGWELQDGKRKWRFYSEDVKDKGFKHISLSWAKPSWTVAPHRITVGSCTFTKIKDKQQATNWNIKITCYSYNKSKQDWWEPRITTTLSKSDFKNFFS